MKKTNTNSINEADYSDMLPSFDDSNTTDDKPKQKAIMDFSNLLPNFISK